MKVASFLSPLFIICICFPFVSVYPIASDVQPMAFFISLSLILTKTFDNRFNINKYYLFGIACLYLISLRISLEAFDRQELGKIFAIYVAFFTFWGLTLLKIEQIKKILPYSIVIYFFLSCLMLIYPNELISAQNLIIRNTNSVIIGYRGVSTLSTEPGLLAGLIVGLLALLDQIKCKMLISRKAFMLVWIMGVMVILMTKSGTGLAYLLFYLIIRNVDSVSLKTVSLILLMFVFLFIFLFFISTGDYKEQLESLGRAGSILQKLATSPQDLTGDRSIFYRLFAVYVGFLCMITYPFGVGFGSVDDVSNVIISQNAFLKQFYFSYGESFHAVSSFGYYTSALGILFFVPFLWFLFFSKVRLDYKLLIILFIFFSYSIAFPIIWALLVFGLKPKVTNLEQN